MGRIKEVDIETKEEKERILNLSQNELISEYIDTLAMQEMVELLHDLIYGDFEDFKDTMTEVLLENI